MPVIKAFEKISVWDQICKDYEQKKRHESKNNDEIEYDPAKHNPVFYGYGYQTFKLDDETLLNDFDASNTHPACFGYCLRPNVPEKKTSLVEIENTFDRNNCTEKEYIENLVFPTLLPALESMLEQAKLNRCFEKKRTAFNACDFITDYLYKNNPFKSSEERNDRNALTLWEIPFVKDWITVHPRPPIPKSLIWTEEEAALRIQAFYRGYLVRRDAEVQELRKWQKELREENQNIGQRVEKFWSDVPGGPTAQKSITENTSSAIFSSTSSNNVK